MATKKRHGLLEESKTCRLLPRAGAVFLFLVLRKYKYRTIFTGSASPLCVLCDLSEAGVQILSDSAGFFLTRLSCFR
jgi:hypothetical protein